jgi:hypothetical protein
LPCTVNECWHIRLQALQQRLMEVRHTSVLFATQKQAWSFTCLRHSRATTGIAYGMLQRSSWMGMRSRYLSKPRCLVSLEIVVSYS